MNNTTNSDKTKNNSDNMNDINLNSNNSNNNKPDDAIIATPSNFIKNIVIDDLKTGKHRQIITRFPPEPNGYLHIGHAKSICLNFGLALEFNGECNLRFDDTNPEKETEEYLRSIQESITWLGFNWSGQVKYASDYFDKLYEFAEFFIKQGLAYVCDLTSEEIRTMRGNLTESGKNSPNRDRDISENLDLFTRMKNGEFQDGAKTLRLKIDMSSPNINLRDPVIYRIKYAHHIKTGDKWCIYPMYDYTHCISDALENITHSCCTLEFEDHRPLYDWVINHLVEANLLKSHPRQIEFSRLELQYTVTSKRKLNQLVVEQLVTGWDDPRMPTIMGMRRRGYTPNGLKIFASRCGVSKSPNIVDMSLLEASVREDLEHTAPRIMAVLNPIKIILTNFNPDNEHNDKPITKSRVASFHPNRPEFGERLVELTKEIYIEREDFMQNPVANWQRLTLNSEVRLRHSYIIKCDHILFDIAGEISELHCSIDHDTLGKNPIGRKVKGVIHWVSCTKSVTATVNIYDRLFTDPSPDKVDGKNFTELLNPNSRKTTVAYVEPEAQNAPNEKNYQFERLGYFVTDRFDHIPNEFLVFNQTVSLKDTFKKIAK